METSVDFLREFIVTWKVNFASLECKNGVRDITEVEKGFQDQVFCGEKELMKESFVVEQVLTLDELLKQSNWESVCIFIMDEVLKLDSTSRLEEKEYIDEHLEYVYDDETVFFYERKEFIGCSTKSTSVYYPIEEKVSKEVLDILKQIDFTGKVIKRKGLLK